MNSDEDPECPGAGRPCWVNPGSGQDPETIGRSEEGLPCGQTSKVWSLAQSYLGSSPVLPPYPPHRAGNQPVHFNAAKSLLIRSFLCERWPRNSHLAPNLLPGQKFSPSSALAQTSPAMSVSLAGMWVP